MEIYNEISKKILELQKGSQNNDPNNKEMKLFSEVMNNNFENNEKFHAIYRECIIEIMKVIKSNEKQTKDTLLCLYYLNICLNPYDSFKEINYDFNKFYEDNENLIYE